ncbi:lipoprotein LipL36 [Leptospira interrogans]|uniref:lipoprotein LipL36 n=1 Tax=Leptospira interrogans TaxID=173 RepID=UPI0009E58F8F|nr:lipoprotein LipL36 [Leptospira interrogans]
MRRNIMKIAAVAALTVALTACKSDDDDDDVVMLALLYLADQTSGNCVTITKSDANGDGIPTYTATGTTKPKAACSGNFNTVAIVGNSAAVADSVKASYQAAIDKADASGSNCPNTKLFLANFMTNATTLKVDQALATSFSCSSAAGALLTGWNLNPLTLGGSSVSVDPAYFGKTVYACSSEKAKENLLIRLNANTFSTVAGSVATDMATNLAFRQKSAAVTASNFKWTADAAAKGRLLNVTELTAAGKSGAALLAFTFAIVNGERTCAKDILSKESEDVQRTAAALFDFDPANFTFFAGAMTGATLPAQINSVITTAQAESVTEVLFSKLACQYGDFDEEAVGNKQTVGTEANVKISGTCPTTYPKY